MTDVPASESSENITLVPDLAGIIEIFGRSLYNDFGAIVRELVQNAHDAIVERQSKEVGSPFTFSRSWIWVHYDAFKRTLVVQDNGKGMDRQELISCLNYFGRPRKTDVRSEVKAKSEDISVQIIGLYGVGFLAAMAMSERVEVWSMAVGGKPVLWEYEQGGSKAKASDVAPQDFTRMRQIHALGKVDAAEPGTLVVCKISKSTEEEYEVHEDTIRNSLLRYARLLPIPLYFKGEQISGKMHTWNQPALATKRDWEESVQSLTGQKPLLVIPIYSPPSELDLQGVLWIPERHKYRGEECSIDVYIRRMFVASDDRVIRPSWAGFIAGMVNSNRLGRIVSGNSIIEDKHSGEVAAFIKSSILEAFRELRSFSVEDYWAVVGEHDDIIKESAVDNAEFLDCVWDKLRVRARTRLTTLPDYLAEVERRSGRKQTLYYFDEPTQAFAAGVISDATGVPVLSLDGASDRAFVKAVSRHKKLEMHPSTDLAGDVIKRPENADRYQALVLACAHNKIAAEVREYEPSHMPAMLVEDGSLQERRQEILSILSSSSDHNTSRIAAQLAQTFARESSLNRDVAFYLNSSNELINQLLDATPETQQSICMALYNISYMSIMPQLRKAEVATIYTSLCTVLRKLLDQTILRKPSGRNTQAGRPTRVFMITPFADEYIPVEKAVRQVFEGPPYFFEVVLARDFMMESRLFDDVTAHIEAADAFVADISDLNPNVMLELGGVIFNKGDKRPIVALRHRGAKEVPADLRAQLTIRYGAPSDGVEEIAKAIRSMLQVNGQTSHREITELLERRKCRALTANLLARTRCTLDETEKKNVLSAFTSLEHLVGIESTEGARRAKLDDGLFAFMQQQLRDLSIVHLAAENRGAKTDHA